MKVYIVTKGWYSDFHNSRVFTDKTKADMYRASIGDEDETGIEEWDTDDDWNPDRVWWEVSVRERDAWAATWRTEDEPAEVNVFYRTPSGGNHEWFWKGYVQARTEEHAIKIARELVIMKIAQMVGVG